MSERNIPSGIPEGPVILHPGCTRREVEAARQSPQGRMYGVEVRPVDLERENASRS